MADTRCDLTELWRSDCDHCRGTDTPPRRAERPDPDLGPWFTAAYPGDCAGCGGDIEPGDRIRADGDGGYLCDQCGKDEGDG